MKCIDPEESHRILFNSLELVRCQLKNDLFTQPRVTESAHRQRTRHMGNSLPFSSNLWLIPILPIWSNYPDSCACLTPLCSDKLITEKRQTASCREECLRSNQGKASLCYNYANNRAESVIFQIHTRLFYFSTAAECKLKCGIAESMLF